MRLIFSNMAQRFISLNTLRFQHIFPIIPSLTISKKPLIQRCQHNCKFIMPSVLSCFPREKHTRASVPFTYTRITRSYSIHGSISDEETAKDFVYSLDSNERKHLYAELARFHGDEVLSKLSN